MLLLNKRPLLLLLIIGLAHTFALLSHLSHHSKGFVSFTREGIRARATSQPCLEPCRCKSRKHYNNNRPAVILYSSTDDSSTQGDEDTLARRRKRSMSRREKVAKKEKSLPKSSASVMEVVTDTPTATQINQGSLSSMSGGASSTTPAPTPTTITTNQDGTSSLEDLFGLGNDQLRELMEQELPVPREDLVTGKEIKVDTDKNKVFRLPDLGEFISETTGAAAKEREQMQAIRNADRVDRSNQEEYLKVLQLNPFADADETMFLDEYDIFQSFFGTGKLLNIPIAYLQTGHGILLIILLLATFVSAPGNPLTDFPSEIRDFFRSGLTFTYAINAILAVQAFFKAKEKNLPPTFWATKTFLLGGIAFYEVNEARDPTKLNKNDPSDRKSQRRGSVADPSNRRSRYTNSDNKKR